MRQRLIVAILFLAFAWLGPVLAYSASLAAPTTHGFGLVQCGGAYLPMTDVCAACCSDSGSCATTCALSLGAAIPSTVASAIVGVPHFPAPKVNAPMVAEHHPARLLRPPIA
jgi:hypothetical protein